MGKKKNKKWDADRWQGKRKESVNDSTLIAGWVFLLAIASLFSLFLFNFINNI